jgi:uncharacterized protein YbjT (DUF2867 family)
MSTWLITGSSSGLGRNLARAVLDAGHNAVLGARNPSSVKDLADAHPDTALAVALDVTDHAQVAGAVQARNVSAASTFSSTTPGTATAPPSRKATTPTSPPCSRPTSSARSR